MLPCQCPAAPVPAVKPLCLPVPGYVRSARCRADARWHMTPVQCRRACTTMAQKGRGGSFNPFKDAKKEACLLRSCSKRSICF
jgi:hypothetical protein